MRQNSGTPKFLVKKAVFKSPVLLPDGRVKHELYQDDGYHLTMDKNSLYLALWARPCGGTNELCALINTNQCTILHVEEAGE